MALTSHDAFRFISSQDVSYAASGGTSAASTAFGAQTRWIRVVRVGLVMQPTQAFASYVGDGRLWQTPPQRSCR